MLTCLLAVISGPAVTADPPVVRPSPVTYDVKTTPWPAKKAPPVAPPEMPFAAPVAPPPAPPRTAYKKDHPARPWAAELTRPVATTQERPDAPRPAEDTSAADEPLVPPDGRMFRLDSESQFQQFENERRARLKADPTVPDERKKSLEVVNLPGFVTTPGSTGPFPGRFFAPHESVIEPNFVCHRRLFFEDRNTERYGWTLGPLQPFVSSWKFVRDFEFLPYKLASFPCLKHECSAGLCLPGDPVPWMLYPPGLSVTGALAQAGTVIALFYIIP